jgi:hypothetical protein
MTNLDMMEIWFITGSQHLYGPETLKQVERPFSFSRNLSINSNLRTFIPRFTIPFLKNLEFLSLLTILGQI